ncbi:MULTISPECIES: serine/threonine protein kinase [unclassified Streptomyces]|uniref:serine/threonine protein kinase n=1 Tax=unclassified Streptomyces TaxID=2593676 RepID=UPI00225B7ABD|nr:MULTISPECIES: serine/threonine protein kinase [unclassified Streptomyces]MCX4989250.1 protein kinase [Streptomyces sp. NBC_00568]MCX5005529.1 protein kinase [Streptomyces sp. NBC_00638]
MQPLGVDEPTVVGPYRLLGRLGSGGMGRVYLGRSAGGRTVAVKIVHPHFALDEEFRARFRREVDAARRVGGAWTAPVLDADPEAPVPWVATGYAAGPSLTGAVADGGPLPVHSARVLGAGLAEALAAVHALGLVHRDVKPSNVLLTLDGPLLIDFGIARATDGTASLTSTGVSVGSPGYMSPEQILGKGVTGAADVFSLGAVLAYAATGEPPFPGDSSASLLYKVVHEEPRLDSLDGELRELVASCLAKEPAARPTPGEVAVRLAPQGAARLVSAGWLPGSLVEQVSRSAVQLLNLEATGAAEVAPSGPVGFSSPSVESGPGTAAPGSAGGFGPAPQGFGPPPPPMPTYVPGQRESRAAEPQDAVHREGAPGHQPYDRPGKVSVSVAATSAPGSDGRGRRMSCTVALAVAGALAAVTVGSAFLFDLLPGGGDTNDQGSASGERPSATASRSAPGTGPSASASDPGSDDTASPSEPDSSASAPDPDEQPSTIPASYLGTWEGDGLALNGTLPMGTFRVTVHQAAVGEELGTFRQTDQIGGICDDVLILKKVTKKQIVATSVAEKSNRDVCTKGRHEVRLTPVGSSLTYDTDNAEAGDPVARMTKVD